MDICSWRLYSIDRIIDHNERGRSCLLNNEAIIEWRDLLIDRGVGGALLVKPQKGELLLLDNILLMGALGPTIEEASEPAIRIA